MVTDFSAKDIAIDIEFCTVVHRRSRQGILHFGELCSPEVQNWTNWPARVACALHDLSDRDALFMEYHAVCLRRIGMCGYTAVPEDGHTCLAVIHNLIKCCGMWQI